MWKLTIACIVAARCAGVPVWHGHGRYATEGECVDAGVAILTVARAISDDPPRVGDFRVSCSREQR